MYRLDTLEGRTDSAFQNFRISSNSSANDGEFKKSPSSTVFRCAVVLQDEEFSVMSITRINAYRDNGKSFESKELRTLSLYDSEYAQIINM